LIVLLIGCGKPPTSLGPSAGDSADTANAREQLTGTIRIDGSSTVYPISAVAAELFAEESPEVNVVVKLSGTSSGISKFLLKEIDICDASRTIKAAELEQAKEANIEVLEFTVALDGIAVVANPQNDWVDSMTVEQLKTIWQPEATDQVKNWNQVNPEWPAEAFMLYGPGTASGTFEYFTEMINGKKKASRSDYTASENDNTLVRGVSGDRGSLGYFGLAYYLENSGKLKLIAVDGGKGPIKPSEASVKDGTYAPLSRPLYIYVNQELLERPEGRAFVRFYLKNASDIAVKAKYVAAPDSLHSHNAEVLQAAIGK